MRPIRAELTAISPSTLGVQLDLTAENPNGISLSAQSVTARVMVDGKHDLGTASVPYAFELPAHRTTPLKVPLRIKVSSLPALTALALEGRPIPYAVDGTVQLGGETLRVALPFHWESTLTRQQLLQMSARSLDKLLPGLPLGTP